MNIYQIDRAIEELIESYVDTETGEIITDEEKLKEIQAKMDSLQMERDRKVENLAMACKNLAAESNALKNEENALAKRRSIVDNKLKRAKDYLTQVLAGDKWKSPKVSIYYTTSWSADVDDKFIKWAKRNRKDLLRFKEPEPDKDAIKRLLKQGEEIKHTRLVKGTSTVIK